MRLTPVFDLSADLCASPSWAASSPRADSLFSCVHSAPARPPRSPSPSWQETTPNLLMGCADGRAPLPSLLALMPYGSQQSGGGHIALSGRWHAGKPTGRELPRRHLLPPPALLLARPPALPSPRLLVQHQLYHPFPPAPPSHRLGRVCAQLLAVPRASAELGRDGTCLGSCPE